MNPNPETIDLTHFDVRDIPCRTKHAQIVQRWADLPVGAYFVLINDHDPVPLYYQFNALFRGAFSWEYLVDGPSVFHIKISRLAASPAGPLPPPPRRAVTAQAGTTRDLDLCGLEPPEPMLRILTTLEALPGGTSLRARTDRQPIHLFPELIARGASYTSEAAGDGSWITTITPT